jgi:hypothetical protein
LPLIGISAFDTPNLKSVEDLDTFAESALNRSFSSRLQALLALPDDQPAPYLRVSPGRLPTFGVPARRSVYSVAKYPEDSVAHSFD